MVIHFLPITVLLYFIFSWPSSSLASTCVVVGNGDANFAVNGKQENSFRVFKDCKVVELIKGSDVQVCYTDSAHAKRCEPLEAGEKKVLDNPGDFFNDLTLAKIKQIINPSESKPGGRMLDEDASIPGFPSGEILLPRDKLAFSVNPRLQPKGLKLLSLYENGTNVNPIFEIRVPGGRIEIPASKLEQGKTYRWVAQSSDGSYDNTFRIATKEDQVDFEKQLAESISKTNGSPMAEGILKAEWCHEYEYFFDRDQALRKVYATSH